jgi:heptosyltransferase-1
MTSILLVKTSSLGDVVHNLPVVSDIRRRMPDAAIDWIVEENYRAIPRLHPQVRAVIPANVRRWRRGWWRRETREDMRRVLARLRLERYDAVIDTQGLLKSALLARAAEGTRHGLDWSSAREPLWWCYDRTYRVPWTLHAVERNRLLAARALGYEVPASLEYGLVATEQPADGYAVLLHATSARSKLWPDARWVETGAWLAGRGIAAMLPWGNDTERARAERLAARIAGATVPERLSLDAAARLLGGARVVIGLDTGLTHLAGALGVRTVGVYVSTDPDATGLYGCARAVNVGTAEGPPSSSEVARACERLLGDA